MSSGSRKKRQSVAQTMGGVMFGFEQQVMRTQPPPQELVHHARPDLPAPAGDGSFVTLALPDDPADLDDPWAGYEDPLAGEDEDPWGDYATEAADGEGRAPA